MRASVCWRCPVYKPDLAVSCSSDAGAGAAAAAAAPSHWGEIACAAARCMRRAWPACAGRAPAQACSSEAKHWWVVCLRMNERMCPSVSPTHDSSTGESGFLAWYEIKALLAKATTKVGASSLVLPANTRSAAPGVPPLECPPQWPPAGSPGPGRGQMEGRGRQGQGDLPAAALLQIPPINCQTDPKRARMQTQVVVSQGAKAAYLVDGDQWVSFDLPQTLFMKLLAARELGLGGLMVRRAARGREGGWVGEEAGVWRGKGRHPAKSIVLAVPEERAGGVRAVLVTIN